MEERFDRIDREIGELKTDVGELKTDVAGLKTDVGELKTDVGELKTGVAGLKSLPGQMEELRRHMHVLHESVMDRFAAQKEYSGPTRAEFAEVKEMLSRRLEPLEMAVRAHSADIARLKRARK